MISIEAAEKQLSPLEELIAIHGEYISLRELVEQVKRRCPVMTYEQVALWLTNKLRGLREYRRCDFQVERLMGGWGQVLQGLLSSVVKHGAEAMNSDGQFDEICIRKEDAEGKLNIEFPVMAEFLPPVLTVNDCTYQDDEYHHADNSVSDINNDPSPPAVWENTHGMETAKKFIAGLAIAIAANDKRYQRKDGLNKSAVVRVAENALNKYGGFIGVSDRQLTALISESLKSAPKLKDYTDSEQP
ncbi:hypothetical protein DOW47_09030 [Salmonella enterica subsp. enterica serovar Florida]|uniref:Uncharacterized protein n=2 Tax=Salmonella enterica TaxID=28901 RepID=A0A974KDN2_SALET|nr:hypothetical protein [Salmonella enterica subsp. enterica serovar Florida]OSD65922.1 hypothetical protein R537_21455 [Salmonella enterica subsp. enterica serovar Rough O:d:1,7]